MRVQGSCPMGCPPGTLVLVSPGADLSLSALESVQSARRILCDHRDCPRRTAAQEILDLPHEHRVVFTEDRFAVEHPVRERLDGSMSTCAVHEWVADRFMGPPDEGPGIYNLQTHPPEVSPSMSFRGDATQWTLVRVGNLP